MISSFFWLASCHVAWFLLLLFDWLFSAWLSFHRKYNSRDWKDWYNPMGRLKSCHGLSPPGYGFSPYTIGPTENMERPLGWLKSCKGLEVVSMAWIINKDSCEWSWVWEYFLRVLMDKNVCESPLLLRNVYEIFGVFVRVYECLECKCYWCKVYVFFWVLISF